MDLLEMLNQVLVMGKEYRREGEGFRAYLKLGPFEASYSTTPPPPARSSYRGGPPKPKPLNLLGAQGVIAEYPDLLKQAEETPEYWFIGTKKKLDDKYQEINQKMRDNGFAYERWNQAALQRA
jgi:hypothetical protein